MLNAGLILTDGIALSIVFAVFVVGTLLWKPRMWLQDFPADLQAMIPPKTDAEKRLTILFAIPFFILLFGGLGLSASRFGMDSGFGAMVLHVYLVWQVVNLFDLVIIDWCGIMLVDPMNPPFDGTAGAQGYRDFMFHFVGFIKGSVMGLVFALIVAGIMHSLI